MSQQRYIELVAGLCQAVNLGDPGAALERGAVEVDGFTIQLRYHENDPQAMYINLELGPIATQRILRIFQLMLESNLTLYAQDQAQLGLDESNNALLCVRIPISDELDGTWMAETCAHYTEHGRYWRTNLSNASDDMFNGLCEGRYMWMRT